MTIATIQRSAIWGEPLEFHSVELERVRSVPGREQYPTEALGPVIAPAVRGIADRVQAPVELAAQSCLAAASFTAQSLVDVDLEGRPRPVSLFLLSEGESGDRKTGTDNVAIAPLMSRLRELRRIYQEARQEYDDGAAVFQAEYRRLLKGKGDRDAKLASLRDLQRPVPPAEPTCICEEPTLEGLQKSFVRGLPSQALLSGEGGQFFGGHAMNPDNAMKTIAGLSKFWDGDPIMRTRATEGESALLFDRRLTVHLMIQPIIGDKVLTDPLLLQQGILARFLMVDPPTLAGTRLMLAPE